MIKVIIFSLLILISLNSNACPGGYKAIGKYGLSSGHVTYKGKKIEESEVSEKNRNKKISIPLNTKDEVEVKIVYVKTVKGDPTQIVATYYEVIEKGLKPRIIEVKSNISESGAVSRSINLDVPPKSDESYGCGGGGYGEPKEDKANM